MPCNLMSRDPAHQPVETTELEMFDGFLSRWRVAVVDGGTEASVTVLQDTASGQSIIVAGTIDLPEASALGTFVPIKGFGGAYSAVSLHRAFVRTNIFVVHAKVAVVPELPVKGVTFLLGNDLAHQQVAVTLAMWQRPRCWRRNIKRLSLPVQSPGPKHRPS